MIRLRIKNFGPIQNGTPSDNDWIEFKHVTVFIGKQGSGKSTVAKLFSTFSWIEKALVRGDYDQKWFERKGRFNKQLLTYHRMEHYLRSDDEEPTELEYTGNAFSFNYRLGALTIQKKSVENRSSNYQLPQVMYVPAERNFIAYVRQPKELKLSSEALKEFLTEFDKAKASMSGPIKLPINNSEIEYDKLNDLLNLKGPEHKLRLTDASSGFQSLVPLFLVSRHLAQTVQSKEKEGSDNQPPMSTEELERFKKWALNIFADNTLTDEQQRAAISALSARFNKTAFVNIVEEPEQNLFPTSQWEMLKCLLEFNAKSSHNRLVLTTHSPYIVNYLSLSVQAYQLHEKLSLFGREDLLDKLYAIVPFEAMIAPNNLAIYQSDEKNGTMSLLPTLEGVPSDRNQLNQFLRHGNDIFDQLLALEEEI